MVTRSNQDYDKYFMEVEAWATKRKGEKKAKTFINYLHSRYDKYRRVYLDYKYAMQLMSVRHYMLKTGTCFICIVGVGGQGKSTLMNNMGYFLDPEYNPSFLVTTTDNLVKRMASLPPTKAYRVIGIDEPDDKYHRASDKGKILASILGKCRQQHLCLIFCATDLKDIPIYIFRKFHVIIFVPFKGKAVMFKDHLRKSKFIIQKIRDKYSEYGYDIFNIIRKKHGGLLINTFRYSPFDVEHGEQYLNTKAEDYSNDLKAFVTYADRKKSDKIKPMDSKIEILNAMRSRGLSFKQIKESTGIAEATAFRLLKRKHSNTPIEALQN